MLNYSKLINWVFYLIFAKSPPPDYNKYSVYLDMSIVAMSYTRTLGHHQINSQVNQTKARTPIDYIIYLVVIFGPLSNLPQLYNIRVLGESDWVSALSWGIFALISCSWMCYGIVHRDKPLIIMNSVLIVIQSTIVLWVIISLLSAYWLIRHHYYY